MPGFTDIGGRIKVRFSRGKTDDSLPFGLHGFGFGVDGKGL
jgi:hypothetical protein